MCVKQTHCFPANTILETIDRRGLFLTNQGLFVCGTQGNGYGDAPQSGTSNGTHRINKTTHIIGLLFSKQVSHTRSNINIQYSVNSYLLCKDKPIIGF